MSPALVSIDTTSVGVGGGAVTVIIGIIAVVNGGLQSFRDFLKEKKAERGDEDAHKASYISVTSDQFIALNTRLEGENTRLLARVDSLERQLDIASVKLDEATRVIGQQNATISAQSATIRDLTDRVAKLEGS